jgi:hypothetical protein
MQREDLHPCASKAVCAKKLTPRHQSDRTHEKGRASSRSYNAATPQDS